MANFQKNKHEVLKAMKELNEKNVRYEREIGRLNRELADSHESIALLKMTIKQLENIHLRELQSIKENFEVFLKESLLTNNRKRIYELEKKLAAKDDEIANLNNEKAKACDDLRNKLSQKQTEFDLIKTEYQNLLRERAKDESRRKKETTGVRGTIVSHSADDHTDSHNDSFTSNKRPQARCQSRKPPNKIDKYEKTSKKIARTIRNSSRSESSSVDRNVSTSTNNKNNKNNQKKKQPVKKKNYKQANKQNASNFQNDLLYRMNKF